MSRTWKIRHSRSLHCKAVCTAEIAVFFKRQSSLIQPWLSFWLSKGFMLLFSELSTVLICKELLHWANKSIKILYYTDSRSLPQGKENIPRPSSRLPSLDDSLLNRSSLERRAHYYFFPNQGSFHTLQRASFISWWDIKFTKQIPCSSPLTS